MTQGHELGALDVMNSGLWMTRTIPGHELKPLDAINNSKVWIICTL